MRQKNVFFSSSLSCRALPSTHARFFSFSFFSIHSTPFLLLLLSGQYIRNGDAIAVISYERIEEEEEEKLPITILLFPPSSCREREEKKRKK
jgi:hypothetical protein